MIVAVIGASRGVGKELVKQLAGMKDTRVIASTRSPQRDLEGSNVKLITLDITDDESVTVAAKNI